MDNKREYTNIAIGDIGTQFFWFNKDNYTKASITSDNFEANKSKLFSLSGKTYSPLSSEATFIAGTDYYLKGAFEYAIPVTAGAEFGGDRESFEAPETDLDYVPKIGGRNSLNDIEYTVNYTKEKYARIAEITNNTVGQVYMEVFQDGSCAIFKGTSGIPTITSGDVRQLTLGITPDFLVVIQDIYKLSSPDETSKLDSLSSDLKALYATDADKYESLSLYNGTKLIIDLDSIPTARDNYKASKSV